MKTITRYAYRGLIITTLCLGTWLASLPLGQPVSARPSPTSGERAVASRPQAQTAPCEGPFLPVSPALTDLGANEYIRIPGGRGGVISGPTGFTGGLYPGNVNERPAEHTTAGLWMASQIKPLDAAGVPDPNGKIGLLGIGMSNTASEFQDFWRLERADPAVNPRVTIVNAAQAGKVASYWVDPLDPAWEFLDDMMAHREVTDPQIQVVWIKLTNFYMFDFPHDQLQLQADLETILRMLKEKFPNLLLAYFSSRTRSYAYWQGGGPEPGAFENGFAVKWLIEKQINGDASLNFDPRRGPVLVPYLSWGPYLWADGQNARSDGLVWLQSDLKDDCIHPSFAGRAKVANMLLAFFKSDVTTTSWFLADPGEIPPPPYTIYLINIHNYNVEGSSADPVRPVGSQPQKR